MDLLKFRKNYRSQFGEDGIIEKIFTVIQPTQKLFVEFGAWDGETLSNTYNLYKNHGWGGLYIEGDSKKYALLEERFKLCDRMMTEQCYIESHGKYSLGNILKKHDFPKDFDLLSIDIDGNEYEVWESFEEFQPSVVIIEYNPTIPPYYEFIDRGGRSFMGSSCLALYKLGKKKGYEMVCCTESNCFFVKKEFFYLFGIKDNSPQNLQYKDKLCFVALNHSGEVVFEKDIFEVNKIRFILYNRLVKFIKHALLRKKSFYFLGERYK